MENKKKVAIGTVALLLIVLGAWTLRGDGVDPAVAALEAQRDVMFSPEVTDADRAAFRARIDALTEEQRRQFFQRSRPEMERRIAERMNEMFNQPPEQLRREAVQRAAEIIADRATRGPDVGGPAGGDRGSRGRGPMTAAQRDSMRKQMLDNIPSQTRAQFSEFRKMINDELKAKGQEEMSGRDMRAMMGGRGGGRGRGPV